MKTLLVISLVSVLFSSVACHNQVQSQQKPQEQQKVNVTSYWQASGDKWMLATTNQAMVDYKNSGTELDLIYAFNPNGTGAVMSNDKKLVIVNFDYTLNGDLLVINDGKNNYYFKKFNDSTYICNNNFGGGGNVKLRKL